MNENSLGFVVPCPVTMERTKKADAEFWSLMSELTHERSVSTAKRQKSKFIETHTPANTNGNITIPLLSSDVPDDRKPTPKGKSNRSEKSVTEIQKRIERSKSKRQREHFDRKLLSAIYDEPNAIGEKTGNGIIAIRPVKDSRNRGFVARKANKRASTRNLQLRETDYDAIRDNCIAVHGKTDKNGLTINTIHKRARRNNRAVFACAKCGKLSRRHAKRIALGKASKCNVCDRTDGLVNLSEHGHTFRATGRQLLNRPLFVVVYGQRKLRVSTTFEPSFERFGKTAVFIPVLPNVDLYRELSRVLPNERIKIVRHSFASRIVALGNGFSASVKRLTASSIVTLPSANDRETLIAENVLKQVSDWFDAQRNLRATQARFK